MLPLCAVKVRYVARKELEFVHPGPSNAAGWKPGWIRLYESGRRMLHGPHVRAECIEPGKPRLLQSPLKLRYGTSLALMRRLDAVATALAGPAIGWVELMPFTARGCWSEIPHNCGRFRTRASLLGYPSTDSRTRSASFWSTNGLHGRHYTPDRSEPMQGVSSCSWTHLSAPPLLPSDRFIADGRHIKVGGQV